MESLLSKSGNQRFVISLQNHPERWISLKIQRKENTGKHSKKRANTLLRQYKFRKSWLALQQCKRPYAEDELSSVSTCRARELSQCGRWESTSIDLCYLIIIELNEGIILADVIRSSRKKEDTESEEYTFHKDDKWGRHSHEYSWRKSECKNDNYTFWNEKSSTKAHIVYNAQKLCTSVQNLLFRHWKLSLLAQQIAQHDTSSKQAISGKKTQGSTISFLLDSEWWEKSNK